MRMKPFQTVMISFSFFMIASSRSFVNFSSSFCDWVSPSFDSSSGMPSFWAEKKALLTRLSRIEGQVRGVRAMVEDDRYCVDIVTQVSAIQAALNGFNKELLARHIKTCVSEDIKEGNEQAVDELCELLKKLMK